MSCQPYNSAVGLFINTCTWGMQGFSQWSVQFATSSGQPSNVLQILKNGSVVCSLTVRNRQTTRWIFFPAGNYLAVRDVVTSGGTDDYKIWLFNLAGSPVVFREVGGGPWGVPSGKQLQFHPSPDGLAFFVFYADSLPNTTKQHIVFRSDTLVQLCSWGTIASDPGQRLAEITNARTVRILTSPGAGGGTTYNECPLPSGKCSVPSLLDFHDVVLDGPEERTKTLSIAISNTGNDCLRIDGIAGVDPFSVVSPVSFPVFIQSGQHVDCTVKFVPSGTGPFEEKLPISLTAAHPASATELHCRGNGRNSLARCEINGEGQVLQVIFGVNNTAIGNYGIKNAGDDHLRVESINDSQHFKIARPAPDYTQLIGHNVQLPVKVEFAPTAVAMTPPLKESLPVTCTPPNGASQIRCQGSARLPNLGLTAGSPESFTTYCFRRKTVAINVQNTGEVPLDLSVSSAYPSYSCANPGSILPGTTRPLLVEVWSGQLGGFTVPLTIRGTFHLLVKDKAGKVIMDNNLESSCAVAVSGTVIPMPPDFLEPNDDFDVAARVDLPLPNFYDPAQIVFSSLSLDDHGGGNDRDCFAVSYQSIPQDDDCAQDSMTSLSLGMVMQIYAPRFAIRTGTSPELRDSGSPFSRLLQIYKSDAYSRSFVAACSQDFVIKGPTLEFTDKKLYAVISNPDYLSQGPVEYNIQFQYTPKKSILKCGGGVTKIEYIKLKKYYDAVWHVDPPHDLNGNPLDVVAWAHGAPAVIGDLRGYIDKHLAYISRAEVLESLHKAEGRSANAILASECLNLAQAARAGGLPEEAEKLYLKSAGYAAKGHKLDQHADALRGLIGLYAANQLTDKTVAVEKELRALKGKGGIHLGK